MGINSKFGRLENGQLVYAPNPLIISGRPVTTQRADIYFTQGYKPIEYTAQPSAELGYVWVASWMETDSKIVREWLRYEAEPTAVDDMSAMLIDIEFRLTLLELGLTE